MWDEFAGYEFINARSREDFVYAGRKAAIVAPVKPDTEKRWAIYTEYFGAFPVVAEALLEKGFYIVRFENENRWGLDEDQRLRRGFADYLRNERGFARRCALIGMSCGGLHAVRFAGLYPEYVSCMYLDAPVINLLSCPLGIGGQSVKNDEVVAECVDALGMESADEILYYRKHGVDAIPALVANKIPAVIVYGDADTVVPFAQNGAILAAAYEKAGVPVKVIKKPGCGHHPHGLADPSPIVDFILKY